MVLPLASVRDGQLQGGGIVGVSGGGAVRRDGLSEVAVGIVLVFPEVAAAIGVDVVEGNVDAELEQSQLRCIGGPVVGVRERGARGAAGVDSRPRVRS